MKTPILALILSILIIGTISAQAPFQKTYEVKSRISEEPSWETGGYIAHTHDTGYIITGYHSEFPDYDIPLIKINSKGDTLWTKTYGTTNFNDYGESVQQTTDKGYIITGNSYNSSNGGTSYVHLLKTDSIGNLLWNKAYHKNGKGTGIDVQQTSDGGYIILGYEYIFGYTDIFLIKTDAKGEILWAKVYGGSKADISQALKQTKDGGYIILGYTESFGEGSDDAFLIKVNSIGDIVWAKTYGNSFSDHAQTLDFSSDNGYIIAGNTQSFIKGPVNGFISKIDSSGNLLWIKTYVCSNSSHLFLSVKSTSDNGYILAGYISDTLTTKHYTSLTKTDSAGNIIWSRKFGGPRSSGYSVLESLDSGYIVIGQTLFTDNYDAYLIKTDKKGNGSCYQDTTDITMINFTFTTNNPIFQVAAGGSIIDSFGIYTRSGGIVTDPCLTEEINEQKPQNTISIFPNPSSGSFSFNLMGMKMEYSKHCQLIVLNSLGEMVYSATITNQQFLVNLNEEARGMYFYRITEENQEIHSGKLIVN